jgi:hypothetical protein
MFIKYHGPDLVLGQCLLIEAEFHQKGHSGMAHEIQIGGIRHMPVGVDITPADFKVF